MTPVDRAIIEYINQFAQRWPTFDSVVVIVANSPHVKGAVLMTLFWALWFWGVGDQENRRRVLLCTLGGSMAAVAAARILALVLPFQIRPIHDPALHFILPTSMNATHLLHLSSFPSDHAALFMGLAMGILLVSRRWGWFAIVFATIFILLPRLYLGLHYPSDLVVGSVLGISVVYGVARSRLGTAMSVMALSWSKKSPATFYAAVFFLTYEIGLLFGAFIALGGVVLEVLS